MKDSTCTVHVHAGTDLSLEVSSRQCEVVELLRLCGADDVLLAGTQSHAHDVVGEGPSLPRHQVGGGVSPDADCPGLLVEVLVVGLLKEVEGATAS